jgi:hypothetical protein
LRNRNCVDRETRTKFGAMAGAILPENWATRPRCTGRRGLTAWGLVHARQEEIQAPVVVEVPLGLGCQEISVGFGYASGQAAIAHFGLGKETLADLEVTLPHGKGILTEKSVQADQRVTLK